MEENSQTISVSNSKSSDSVTSRETLATAVAPAEVPAPTETAASCPSDQAMEPFINERANQLEEERLVELFHNLDTNNDGRINLQELLIGLKKMGYVHVTQEQVEVRILFRK